MTESKETNLGRFMEFHVNVSGSLKPNIASHQHFSFCSRQILGRKLTFLKYEYVILKQIVCYKIFQKLDISSNYKFY